MKYAVIALLATGAIVAAQQLPRADDDAADTTAADDAVCTVRGASATLPRDLAETSGLALGAGDRLWTHNDGGEATLFALDATGRVVQEVRIDGAKLDDWEDLESSACATGTCLYIADTGDNDGRRRDISIHVVPEPAAGERRVRVTSTVRARYPDGAQDAEALFALPGGQLFVVTKGRHGPIALYRVPPSQSADAVVLERVRELSGRPDNPFDLVSAATATPDGRWVAIRTYRAMMLFPAQKLVSGEPVQPVHVDLTDLQHAQGESVALDAAGNAWFTSEDETGNSPRLARMTCRLEQ
jgi:hypothetical protein